MAHVLGGDGWPVWGSAVFSGGPDATGATTTLTSAQAGALYALAREVETQVDLVEGTRARIERGGAPACRFAACPGCGPPGRPEWCLSW